MIARYSVPPPVKPNTDDIYRACSHPTVATYQRIVRGGQVQVHQICEECWRSVKTLKKSDLPIKVFNSLPMITTKQMDDAAFERERKRYESVHDYNKAWWEWYNEYLNSPIWKSRRDAVLKRSGYKCEACGADHAVHVHHVSYRHVGAEPFWDLRAVCKECHLVLHEDPDPSPFTRRV